MKPRTLLVLSLGIALASVGQAGPPASLTPFATDVPSQPASRGPAAAAPTALFRDGRKPSHFERETTQKFTDLKSIIEDASFDRLDGHGKSRKKVDVIEWEGNLEIHVYPAKSLSGLALKIDDRNSKRPVMVVGYRFENAPKRQLIRRALLGIALKSGFHAYRDPAGGTEYDKIVISQSQLPKPLEELKLDPEPDRLYPDGHPLNDEPASAPSTPPQALPLSDATRESATRVSKTRRPAAVHAQEIRSDSDSEGGTMDEDSGSIRPFRW